jgi:hypothetical protein
MIVASVAELQKRESSALDPYIKKKKDGKNRATGDDIVDLLRGSILNKRKSARQQKIIDSMQKRMKRNQ